MYIQISEVEFSICYDMSEVRKEYGIADGLKANKCKYIEVSK